MNEADAVRPTGGEPTVTETIDLVGRAQTGDMAAYERLFARYYDRVKRIVRMRVGPSSGHRLDSEDLVQETFVAAIQSFERLEVREPASFLNWLAKLAENQIRDALDYHRAAKRDARRERALRHLRSSIDNGTLLHEPAAETTLPDGKVVKKEQAAAVEECIALLPDNYREVILLRDYLQGSWAFVAEELASPSEDAARMLHGRAKVELMKVLRRRLGPGGVADR